MVEMEDWLVELYAELEEQGIAIPERLNEDELRRFYDVWDGDFAKFLSSVKKSIQWRHKYTFLSPQELKPWSKFVFWHGSDVMQRPSLIIRIGLAASNLDSDEQTEFVKVVVSQVEYGVVNLLDVENSQFTVLLDCNRLSPFEFPLQKFRSSVDLLQDHYPNRLGCLLVARVPSVAEVMTQNIYQELRPGTLPKVTFVGTGYREFLSRYFKELPHFPLTKVDALVIAMVLFILICMGSLLVVLLCFVRP